MRSQIITKSWKNYLYHVENMRFSAFENVNQNITQSKKN